MIISPPLLPHEGLTSSDPTELDPMMKAVHQFELDHGIYPVAVDRRWHGGIHLAPTMDSAIHAIADGEVVAYRVCQHAHDAGEGSPDSNAGFVLLKHVTETGEGRTLTFYSLYMHLLELAGYQPIGADAERIPAFLRLPTAGSEARVIGPARPGAEHKVYRKDILGWIGRCHGQKHLHFEIFMTQADFSAYFDQTQFGTAQPKTSAIPNAQVWGKNYYVIPGGTVFRSGPPTHADSDEFPALHDGRLDAQHTLYVEAYFHRGNRYTRSWIDRGDRHLAPLTEEPVEDPGYEYNLYKRATALYPDCPSDGYELLRFGRILSSTATLGNDTYQAGAGFSADFAGAPRQSQRESPRATWVAVTYDAGGNRGYVDLNQDSIQKLSDADFPFFTGWQKITDGHTPFDADGLCGYEELRTLIGDVDATETTTQRDDPAFTQDDLLSTYVKRNDAVRQKLRGFICEARSEWDSSNNENRYKKLKDEGGFFHGNEAGYGTFITRLTSLQFWDKTGLEPGRKLWFFHPLAFIQHFRKCSWLSESEFKQLVPKYAMRKDNGTMLLEQVKDPYRVAGGALPKSQRIPLNCMLRTFGITTAQRMASFFGNAIQETQWLTKLAERSTQARYAPWDGRGFLQLTWPSNYLEYWDFRGRATQIPDSIRIALRDAQQSAGSTGSNAQLLVVESELSDGMRTWRDDLQDRERTDASHSAGFYWVSLQMARHADEPHLLQRVSVLTNVGLKCYFRSPSFWKTSASVNIPAAINTLYSTRLNGFEARCAAYAVALFVLGEVTFPSPNGEQLPTPDHYIVRPR